MMFASTHHPRGHAVVLGGGIAGLASAAALTRQFASVEILDARTDETPMPLTAQGPHLHVLLSRGREALENLFPGLDARLAALGCPEIDWAQDTQWFSRHGEFPRYSSKMLTRSSSRSALESALRDILRSHPRVTLRFGAKVASLDKESHLIRAAVLADGERRKGDFFVNALGAGPHSFAKEDHMREYGPTNTVFYHSSEIAPLILPSGYKQLYIQMQKATSYIGLVVNPIENNRMMLTLLSTGRPVARTVDDVKSIVAAHLAPFCGRVFAESIHFLTPLKHFRFERSVRQCSRDTFANGTTVGDALCRVNPIYGQGMTLAAIQASRLAAGHRISRSSLTWPWLLASCEDSLLAHEISPPLLRRVGRALIDLFLRGAQRSVLIHRVFLATLHMKVMP